MIGEIVVEQSSYAQQYFKDFYEDEYNLVVIDNPQINATTASTPIDKNDKLFCRRCGIQLPLDSDFCFKCGTKVEKEVM